MSNISHPYNVSEGVLLRPGKESTDITLLLRRLLNLLEYLPSHVEITFSMKDSEDGKMLQYQAHLTKPKPELLTLEE